MPKSVISEGRTTTEAINKGLKELHAHKDQVDIKILENEEKRSFFSILTPRVVKVELTLKDGEEGKREITGSQPNHNHKEIKKASKEQIQTAKQNIEQFLNDFVKNFEDIHYDITVDEEFIHVNIDGKQASHLIGYRGDVLNSLQIIINSIANKGMDTKVRVVLNIGNYKEKREKALEELADKICRTVMKNGKPVTLEPMVAYERKIIHNRLQSSKYVKTYSVGEEPYRKVVIAKK